MLDEISPYLPKLCSFCAYQDRCRKEICERMAELFVPEDYYEEILAWLEKEKFWDEARFVRQYVGGKFRVKQWGKQKIRHEIKKHQVPSQWVELAIQEEISDEAYQETLQDLITKKGREVGGMKSLAQQQKVIRFLQQRGFEWDEIWANMQLMK